MPAARFILCERTGKWVVALRRALSASGPRVFETRHLDDCWKEVVACPASMVAVEVTAANLPHVTTWLRQFSHRFCHAQAVVLGARGLESSEWLLREMGAVHVVFSPRDMTSLIRVVRRHVAGHPAGERSPRQLVWQRMPWADGEVP